jgi:hypothetical protein
MACLCVCGGGWGWRGRLPPPLLLLPLLLHLARLEETAPRPAADSAPA